MIRTSIISTATGSFALCLSLVTTGCDRRAADDQAKADQAQAEADRKIAEAQREEIVETRSAQVEADKKIAEAQADFSKRREDYRHELDADLIDIDKKIEKAEAELKTATGKKKADLEANLAAVRAQRDKITSESAALERASASTWDDTKARVDKDMSDLKSAAGKL